MKKFLHVFQKDIKQLTPICVTHHNHNLHHKYFDLNWKEAIRSGPFSETQSAALIAAIETVSNEQLQWLRGYFAGESVTQKMGVQNDARIDNGEATSLTILYGTQTGNSQKLADFFAKKCKARNINAVVQNMSTFKAKDFK